MPIASGWHGDWKEVTFDPHLFDEHPNTLTLLSYGDSLLDDVLNVVNAPRVGESIGAVARCATVGGRTASQYFELQNQTPLRSIDTLQSAIDTELNVGLSAASRAELEQRFRDSLQFRRSQDAKAAADWKNSRVSSLSEEVRQLLTEAAYVELAIANHRDLFDENMPLDFSEQAYHRLKRHGIPLAGAIKLAGQGLPRPTSIQGYCI
jgi:hypothetical protein